MGKLSKIAEKLGLVLGSVLLIWPARPVSAANASVNINDYVFTDATSGSNVSTINAGESVTWHWPADQHSATSGTCTTGGGAYGEPGCTADGIWDSGKNVAPHTFTQT